MRILVLVYGGIAYLAFLATFVYAMGFVGNVAVSKSIDSEAPTAPAAKAILINAALLMVFVVQHTVMARPGFKRGWKRYVPPAIERSTFVLAASAALALIMWQWRTVGGTVWQVEADWLRWVLVGWSACGWALVLYASFLIDHFDLFGLRQVWLYFRGRAYTHHPFVERSVYKYVRHPLMLGFLIAFWATPHMTAGHLVFAALVTGYVLMGILFEERDLVRHLGPAYLEYRRRTPMLLPWPRRRAASRRSMPAQAPTDEAARTA
jgi:protein-S-isoprenylcysteine O-methyltransferase Ste14